MNYLLDGQSTQRLLFRKLQADDFIHWLEFFQDPLSVADWDSKDTDPFSLCVRWFEKQFWRYENELGGMNALIERKTGAFVGQCGLLIQTVDNQEELEIAYSIMPSYWNNGFATEAALKCCDHAGKNKLSSSLISIINVRNVRSKKVALKIGMSLDKMTDYEDNKVEIYRTMLT